MKKMLLAASMVALVSAAQAQATLSGAIRYDISNSSNTMTTGITKSEINFAATEQLGNGLSVTAKVGLNGAERNGTFSGTDASIALASGMGTVLVGQVKTANSIAALGFGGAPVMGTDGNGPVLAADTNSDVIKYTAPAYRGYTASISSTRTIDATGSRATKFGLAGKVGPVDAAVDYDVTSSRIRASGATQVMGLTVGAGYSGNQMGVADTYVVGASKQFSAFTVGGAYSHSATNSAREVGVSYALSKRTSVRAVYQDLEVGANTAQVRLQHLF